MNLFYVPEISGNEVALDAEESRHLIKVLRFGSGDEVIFTDGKGHRFVSRIKKPDSHSCILEVTAKDFFELPKPKLQVAIAPTKNIDRMEWFMEKAVEVGITTVVPILCEHSERDVIKTERLEKVMVAAMKQSLRYWLPEIKPLTTFTKALELFPSSSRYIAHATGKDQLIKDLKPEHDAFILVGPEGDFTASELKGAEEKGFKMVSLGPSRLRTETAALVVVTAFSFCNLEK